MKETWNADIISWSSINEVCQIDLKKKRSKKFSSISPLSSASSFGKLWF
jgi:hypothetical protein